jgi:hypothetical protein
MTIYYLPKDRLAGRFVHCLNPDCGREVTGLEGHEVPSEIELVGDDDRENQTED